ncbi:hypothetical protein NEOC84_000750|nr:hypothetical protein [Neochlamydia sp. AcF95]NGY94850.1 hypothetical protein [Neochlamydia sp. AcF84]
MIKASAESVKTAPWLSQCCARSASKENSCSTCVANGLYQPIASTYFPSRGERQSATTKR